MSIFVHELYQEDIVNIANLKLPWEKIRNKTIMVTGATGLFGTLLIDVIMFKNSTDSLSCTVIGLGRNKARGLHHFDRYAKNPLFKFVEHDLCEPFSDNDIDSASDKIEYIVHLASNTHPKAYATQPISTITSNVIGTYNLLNFGVKNKCERFVYASTCEIYGENRGDTESLSEKYCGYIDCNTLRAGYPEGKRCGEALCQAFIAEKSADVVIPRFARSYGPTINKDDTKAMSQFLFNALNKEDIVLKSEGTQYYSYTYSADAVSGLLTVMLKGRCGEAYNIADENSNIRLKDLAKVIADNADVSVKFDLPDETEAAGFSKVTDSRLDSAKIKNELGWKAMYSIEDGVRRTLDILSSQENNRP